MASLLHLSDLHFGTEQADVLSAMLALHKTLQPDVVLLSGDLTQRATHREFEDVVRLVSNLAPSRTLLVPGNHDIPLFDVLTRLRRPFSRYQRALGNTLNPELSTAGFHIIGVNSTCAWRHKRGVLTEAQIDSVSQKLRASSNELCKVVALHHPVHVPDNGSPLDCAINAELAVSQWSHAGAHIIAAGHSHVPSLSRLPHSESQRHPCWSVNAGTAISNRTRHGAPNSLFMIMQASEPDAVQVQRWDYTPIDRSFQWIESTPLL